MRRYYIFTWYFKYYIVQNIPRTFSLDIVKQYTHQSLMQMLAKPREVERLDSSDCVSTSSTETFGSRKDLI